MKVYKRLTLEESTARALGITYTCKSGYHPEPTEPLKYQIILSPRDIDNLWIALAEAE